MSVIPCGTWFTYEPPKWKEKLDFTSNWDLEELGMKREELEELLNKLTEMKIIE